MFALMAIFPDEKTDKMAIPICLAMSFFVLLPLPYFYLLTFRTFITANTDGLRWHDINKEYFARWDEVVDFYVDNSRTRKVVVATKNGEINAHNFNNQEAFRAFVQSHATNAASREWTTHHVSKQEKWPRTFAYKHAENVIVPMLPFLLALLILPLHFLDEPATKNSNGIFQILGEMWTFGGLLLTLAFVAMMAIIAAATAMFP